MTVPEFVLFLLVGRLITWLLQDNGLLKPLWELHPTLTELGECDLCLGFWIFLVMALVVGKPTLSTIWPVHFDSLVQAAFSTFTMHLLRLGWHSKFGVAVV